MEDFSNYTKEDYLKLYDKNLDDLIKISSEITRQNFGNKIESCSIISAKTGECSENCKYCSQSKHNHAEIECHPLLDVETVKKAALSAKENGASCFGIVTSGRVPTGKDFEVILDMVRAVSEIKGLQCCVSLGLLSDEQFQKLKEAGAKRYNHNINTSEKYYEFICQTHKFADRIKTVQKAQKIGITPCSGVILGMGETREDRIDMALTLAKLDVRSVPINILNPIKGTPLENYQDKINEDEILKTICIFRIILPKAMLRYAGGRTLRLSKENQEKGIIAGINCIMVGNYLTTTGSRANEDKEMLNEIHMQLV